ncbi:MAG: pinensin family lanthipeptide [Cyclobacteriaceae bacterium]
MKKKMNLADLKVKSFVTKVEGSKEETVKGGVNLVPGPVTKPDTLDFNWCVWYSELNTACECDTREFLCDPFGER